MATPSNGDRIVRCGNPDCGRILDEEPRVPCPACAGTSRVVDVGMDATVHTSATMIRQRIRNYVERNRKWLALSIALTIAGASVGLVVARVPGVIIGLLFGIASYPVSLRAQTRVRELDPPEQS